MKKQIQQSKDAGYSDEEIVNFLSEDKRYAEKTKKSLDEGYTPEQIIGYLGREEHPSGIPSEEERSEMQYPYYAGSTLVQHPVETLTKPIIDFVRLADSLRSAVGGTGFESPLSDWLEEKSGFAALPEEAKENIDIAALALSFLPGLAGIAGEAATGIKNIPSRLKSIGTGEGASIGIPKAISIGELSQEGNETLESFKDLGISLKEKVLGKNLSKTIPDILSTEPIENTTKAGMALEKTLQSGSKQVYKAVGKDYAISEKLNKEFQAVHPDTSSVIEQKVQDWEQIPAPSAPLQKAISSAKQILSRLGNNISGYRPISNQSLINQIQELNKAADFEFAHGSDTGAIKSLISDLSKAVDSTAEIMAHSKMGRKAVKAWNKAKSSYAEWAQTFRNPSTSKWGRLEDKAYARNYRNLEIDEIRQLQSALEKSPGGPQEFQKIKREYIKKVFSDHFTLGGKFEKAQIEEALQELSAILDESEIEQIRKTFEQSRTFTSRLLNLSVDAVKIFKRPSSAISKVKDIK